MVRHYHKILKTAARYGIMLDVHEPIKGTGLRRTYPNMMTREGARGVEYNAGSPDAGNPPDYTTVIPFTRMLSGPFDMTPGIFDLYVGKHPKNRTWTTLAKQLAHYVIIYSPLQMASDFPENYKDHPALKFIQDVPTDWETTRVLNGTIGDYVTIARKDRHSENWYLGSVTDENGRTLTVELDFLDDGKTYQAEIYRDVKGKTHFENNPHEYEIVSKQVRSGESLTLYLAPGGGQAIQFSSIEK